MATLALGTSLTVAELMRREDPNGQPSELIDVLNQENAITPDATWIPCNNKTMHEDGRTASEPTGQDRAYDQGITTEAGVSERVLEHTQMLDGLSVVDVKKLLHTGHYEQNRTINDGFFLRGMAKTFVSRLLSGNRSTHPRRINGIFTRTDYNSLSSDYTYDNAGGNASATANKTSILMVQWGMKMVNCIYPVGDAPGSTGGDSPIKQEDMGKDLIADPNNSSAYYKAERTWFEIHFGIFIHDPRCIKRIVNISTSNIDGVDDFSFDEELMIDMVSDLEYAGAGAVMYCNRTVYAQRRPLGQAGC